MRLELRKKAFEDLQYWISTNPRKATKISTLIEQAIRDPFKGIGKPEPLKGNLSGLWSRRIDEKNRRIYEVTKDVLRIHQARGHYDD